MSDVVDLAGAVNVVKFYVDKEQDPEADPVPSVLVNRWGSWV